MKYAVEALDASERLEFSISDFGFRVISWIAFNVRGKPIHEMTRNPQSAI
jgi:hypothetical protein